MAHRREVDTADYFHAHPLIPETAPHPLASLVKVEFGAASHVGHVRPTNQDAYLISRGARYWEKLLTNLRDGEVPDRFEESAYVLVVADGMGGMAAGEVASSLAIRTAVNLVLHAVKWGFKLGDPQVRETEIREAVDRALSYFRQIDLALTQEVRKHPEFRGMGTTLTVSYSVGDDLFIFHIGDSRAYLHRGGRLAQLTRDHTVAQALADAGVIPKGDVATHRLRHVLTKSIGGKDGDVEAEVQQVRLRDGDKLLLCSDGLTDLVPDDAIAAVLNDAAPPQAAADRLVDMALANGGKDNVTVLVARYAIPSVGKDEG